MSDFFIKRPIVAICISIIIFLLGLFSLFRLPVSEYPDIIPPVIQVTANYPGADCETIVQSIATPLEQQISGVDGMAYMSSVCTNNGELSMNIVFDVGSSPNMDQVLAYLRYGQATSQLPSEVSELGVTLRKTSGPPCLLLSLYSPENSYDGLWLANYAYINFVNLLKRVHGVGDVQVFGAGKYAMRIWLNPEKMAALNISVSETIDAIKAQNTVNPAGKIGAQPAPQNQVQTITVKAPGRLSTPEEFSNIIVRGQGNAVVHLRDIARIELGAQNYTLSSTVNGHPAASIAIYEAPGSNAIDMANAVLKVMDNASLPPDLKYCVALDTTQPVRDGIHDMAKTLGIALLLVLIVVFLFLQGWRGTIIPACAVPVSIIGTFALFPLFGFSINTVCLMGLVLAIGLVVDDAIVVVEAVQNHIEQGKDRKTATLSAMKEVSGPIVSTALVISCVFLPTILLPGVSGLLFEQFALTIGASIILSAFCALSLSPALSSLLLRQEAVRHGLLGRLFHVFNTSFNWLRNAYISLCSSLMRRIGIGIGLLAIITALIWPIAHSLPSGFMPIEDQGYLFAGISLPENTSLNTTEESSAQAEKILQNIPGVATVTTINGFNLMNSVQSPSNAFFFITLDSWAHRKSPSLAASQIASQIRQRFGDEITSGITYVVQPSPIPGVGTSGNVTFLLEDRQGQGESYLTSHTAQFIKVAEESPAIASINNFMIPSVFQYKLNVDTAQATLQGVDVADVFSTLQAYLGSVFVDYFNLYGLQWQVYLQADMNSRDSIDRLSLFHVQTTDGQNVPLNALVSTSPIWAPDFLMRQNMFNCSMLDVSAADGYSSGDVMAALEEVFHKTMPLGMGYDYSGMSYQEQQAAQGLSAGMIFAASTLFVFLILASLYESWTLPLSVLMSVPIAIVGALLSLHFAGLELNIYSEIGLIVTIALAAKNAILIVEFAVLELNRGVPLFQATLNAARIRFRPILMTSIAFICGCIPLALASGAGAAARHVVGICVIGGMLAAVCLGTLLVPVFFLLIAKRKTPPSDIV